MTKRGGMDGVDGSLIMASNKPLASLLSATFSGPVGGFILMHARRAIQERSTHLKGADRLTGPPRHGWGR